MQHAKDGAILINTSTVYVSMTGEPIVGAYQSSKTAAARIFETVQAENPGISVFSVHPGIYNTEANDLA